MANRHTDKKENNRSFSLKKVFIFIWCALPILIFVVVLFFCYKRNTLFVHILDNVRNKSTAITYANIDSMVSAGIGVVAVAVSVWIGLNIYNTITESDLERKFIEKEKTLQENVNVKLRNISQYSLFLEALHVVHADDYKSLSDYFYNRFSSRGFEIEPIDYMELSDLERAYNEIWSLFQESAWDAVLGKANSLRKKLEDKLEKSESATGLSDKAALLLKEYFHARAASIYHCLLISYPLSRAKTQSRNFQEENWLKFEQECIQLLNEKNVPISQGINIKDTLNKDAFEKGFIAVIYNLYGFNAHRESKKNVSISILLNNATKMEPDNATFHHNYGVFYESEWLKSHDQELYEKAVKEYQKAKTCDPHDYKAFNNLGALRLKWFDSELMDRGKDFRSFREIANELKDDQQLSSDVRRKYRHWINKAIIKFMTSIRLSPTFENSYYNLGKAYFYRYLLDKQTNESDYENAINECRVAENISPNSLGWKFVLRNIYEIKNPEKAAKYNAKLDGEGDSNQWTWAYKSSWKTKTTAQ